jgi:hypothetical protein
MGLYSTALRALYKGLSTECGHAIPPSIFVMMIICKGKTDHNIPMEEKGGEEV